MSGKMAKLNRKFFIIVIILVTLSLGCLCLPTGVTPTPPPTQPIAPIVTEPPLVEPPVVEPPSHDTAGLSADGPWLLYETDRGLYAANSDGSGLAQVTDDDYWQWNWKTSIQPVGNLVAFIAPVNDFHNMSLNLVSLPDGTITKITDLTSPETEVYADYMPGDYGLEAMRAVTDEHNTAWSPDGTRLAFVGLMDGPSAEIYIYNTVTGGITRVSDDDAQNYWPSWSHDGNTLVYLGADSFGVGAGFDTTGVWSASGDGTNVRPLYIPASGSEEILGWLADNQTILVQTWHPASGGEGLRLFDIVTKESVSLTDEYTTSVAVDLWGSTAMFATYDGVYLLTDEERTPLLVSEENVAQVKRTEPGGRLFTVSLEDGSLATFGTGDYDHQVSPFSSLTWGLDVAEYGAIWGWTNMDDYHPGAWITGPGIEIGQIYIGPARLPTWDQHNNLLFFADADGGGYDLYRTTFDAYYTDLEIVGHIDIPPYNVAWLGWE